MEFTSPLHSFQLPLALSLPLRAATEKVKIISSLSLGEQVWGLQARQARRQVGGLHSAPPTLLCALGAWHSCPASCKLPSGVANRGRATALEGRGQRGDSPAPPLRVRKWPRFLESFSIASAQSGGKGPHPCCPGALPPFRTPRRSLKPLVCAFCSCWDLAGGDPSLIPTELSLKPVVVVTLFCKGHCCLQFSLLCLN